ncbi:MAG TPA: L-seryl-tRNA(Sec) selenium transferase, partial [Ktedonobacterales bacterium]|nr:L-seryl-tRNA(Sec) selenium transferase [Ktedonobacterales bacterium]
MPASKDELAARARALVVEWQRPALRRVINATGVIINTNLGRAPLSPRALATMHAVAEGYSNLEYDLERGERGSRHAHVRRLLCELTGAEDALVVNNNAAALLVVLSVLAAGREVVISRGELVEIGGGFRVPDVMRQSGARLVEVGTTNRTRLADFTGALTAETALLLAVHPSNFRVIGFTEAPRLGALAELAREHNIPLVHDLGSGCLLPTERFGLGHEPTVQESLAAGADIVCFSGDKLLGGPQAGIIVGRARLLAEIARHPLMRAVRIDKLTLAALAATLTAYNAGTAEGELPVWRMIAAPLATLRQRAEHWASVLRAWGADARVLEGQSTVGGGTLPGETLPTALCAIGGSAKKGEGAETAAQPSVESTRDVADLARMLRVGDLAVVGRVLRDTVLLDPRTVQPDEDDQLL